MPGEAFMKGILEVYGRGIGQELVWQKRFYVLRERTDTREARLDWHESEEDNPRRSIYVQQIADIQECKSPVHSTTRRHVFCICMKESSGGDKHFFAAASQKELKQWVDNFNYLLHLPHPSDKKQTVRRSMSSSSSEESHISDELLYASTGEFKSFPVTITETDASVRCGISGDYDLRIYDLNMSIWRDNKAQHIWPYRHVRRYGRSRSTFTFEAGRKCPSGEGLFTLKVEDGPKVFSDVTIRTKSMKEKEAAKESEPSSLPSPASSVPSSSPSLNTKSLPFVPRSATTSSDTSLANVSSPKSPTANKVTSPLLPKPVKPSIQPKPHKPEKPAPPSLPPPPSLPASLPPRPVPHSTPPSQPVRKFSNEKQPDSGFNTWDNDDPVPLPLTPKSGGGSVFSSLPGTGRSPHITGYEDYSSPADETYASISDEEQTYAEPENFCAADPTTNSMSQLVAVMSKTRIRSQGTRHSDPDSYDHIDLRQAASRTRPSSSGGGVSVPVEVVEDEDEHVYGDLSLDKNTGGHHVEEAEDGYCMVAPTKTKTKKKK